MNINHNRPIKRTKTKDTAIDRNDVTISWSSLSANVSVKHKQFSEISSTVSENRPAILKRNMDEPRDYQP